MPPPAQSTAKSMTRATMGPGSKLHKTRVRRARTMRRHPPTRWDTTAGVPVWDTWDTEITRTGDGTPPPPGRRQSTGKPLPGRLPGVQQDGEYESVFASLRSASNVSACPTCQAQGPNLHLPVLVSAQPHVPVPCVAHALPTSSTSRQSAKPDPFFRLKEAEEDANNHTTAVRLVCRPHTTLFNHPPWIC